MRRSSSSPVRARSAQATASAFTGARRSIPAPGRSSAPRRTGSSAAPTAPTSPSPASASSPPTGPSRSSNENATGKRSVSAPPPRAGRSRRRAPATPRRRSAASLGARRSAGTRRSSANCAPPSCAATSAKAKTKSPKKPPDVQGFDTETYRGRAVLLGTARKFLIRPRSFADCAEFLHSCGSRFVCWNVAFDAQAILRFLPADLLRRLVVVGRVTFEDPRTRRLYRVAYIPRKRLTVTSPDWRRGVHLRDAAVWYGSSLNAAAETHLRKLKLPVPRAWIDDARIPLRRGGRALRRFVLYCRRDAHLAARLYRRVRLAFLSAVTVDIADVASPAGVGARVWRDSLRACAQSAPDLIDRRFARAYFGGRFEVLRLGKVGPLDAWDIRSAYPWALARLPSPWRIVWRETRSTAEVRRAIADPDVYVAARVDVRVPPHRDRSGKEPVAGPIPVRRRDGLLLFPVGAWRGWYAAPDLRALLAAGGTFRVRLAVIGEPPTDLPAFPGLDAMYERRREVRERGDEDAALALKLTMNGLYGKTAERRAYFAPVRGSLGKRRGGSSSLTWTAEGIFVRRRYRARTASFVIAATLTALVREKLWREIPFREATLVATDGVLLRAGVRPRGRHGDRLGDWGLERRNLRGVLLGNGVFHGDDAAGKTLAKVRGYKRGSTVLPDVLARAKHDATSLILPPTLRGRSIGQALRDGDWQSVNDLSEEDRVLRLDSDEKRDWRGKRTAGVLRSRTVASRPPLWLDASVIDPRELVPKAFLRGRRGATAGRRRGGR